MEESGGFIAKKLRKRSDPMKIIQTQEIILEDRIQFNLLFFLISLMEENLLTKLMGLTKSNKNMFMFSSIF
ncbi:hypothetical protein IRJ41_001554 [Triplophysa rosa]|uniref:Uncharacterized protein n=1 Tax=Triplophysa rosa TaxID=992332 RepID=A0A9W7TWY7_TRIRA|nr:hypothetical protein IRJ41_001554 [Triplophysa rosa]